MYNCIREPRVIYIILYSVIHMYTYTQIPDRYYTHTHVDLLYTFRRLERIAVRHFVNFPSILFCPFSSFPFLFLTINPSRTVPKENATVPRWACRWAENKLRINKHVCKAKKGANRQDSRQWFFPFDFWS